MKKVTFVAVVAVVAVALLLFPVAPAASSEPPAPARRIEALERFVVQGQRIWPCCGEDGVRVLSSRAALEKALAESTATSLAAGGPAPAWKEAYLAEVERAIPSFEKETLVLLAVPYGGTGMARASLDFRERDGVLTAEVRITLPPPPLTPDTTVFRFAFAVDRSKVRELEIVTAPPGASGPGASAARKARKVSLR